METVKPSLETENISSDASSSHLINISRLNPEVSKNQNMNSLTKMMKNHNFLLGFDSESLPSVNLSVIQMNKEWVKMIL